MDHQYRCMRSSNITAEFIHKTKDHIYNTMLLLGELNLLVTPSDHLLKDHIFIKWKILWVGLTDISKDHIERHHQNSKRSEKIDCGLKKFQQSQISQLKNNDMMTNSKVKLKSEQIKKNQNKFKT